MNIEHALSDFTGREEALRKITRWSLYDVMFYRTNLWTHSKRVAWLIEEVSPHAVAAFGPRFDPQKAFALALVHDDAEIIMGDYQAGNKSKMSDEELNKIEQEERNAIDKLTRRWPKQVFKYDYRELLLAVLKTDSLESKIVKYIDKLEGLAEALHEVHAGNTSFATNVQNEYGTIPVAFEYYPMFLKRYRENHPELDAFFASDHPLLRLPEPRDYKHLAGTCKPHSESSLRLATGDHLYEAWKSAILPHAVKDGEEFMNLFVQREFLDNRR